MTGARPLWHQIVVYLSLLGLEGCWLYAFVLMGVTGIPESNLSAPLLMVFFPLSFIITVLFDRTGWHRIARQVVVWLCWVAALLLMVKMHLYPQTAWPDTSWLLSIPLSIAHIFYAFEPPLLVLLASVVLWWMGERAARSQADFARLLTEFQFGLMLMVLAFLIASAAQIKLQGVVGLSLIFFSFSLVGVSTAHARENKSWSASLQQGHWGWLLALSICAILAIGLAIATIVSHDLLQLMVDGIKWLWGIILKILLFLASLIPDTGGTIEPLPEMPVPGAEGGDNSQLFKMSDEVRSIITIVMAVIWSGIIILALWRISSQIYAWLARRGGRMQDVEVERLKGAFWTDLLNLLKHIAGLFPQFLRRLGGREKKTELPAAVHIRNTYRQMTRWAASRGYPRPIHQTPYEYLGVLATALPDACDDLDLITQHYVQIRYGMAVPASADCEAVIESWRRIRKYRLKRPYINSNETQEEHEHD